MSKKPSVKYCKHCWQMIDARLTICDFCGKQIDDTHTFNKKKLTEGNLETTGQSHSKLTFSQDQRNMFILCLILGVFGIHRFYQKNILLGVIYLLSFGLLLFGVIHDCINILYFPEKFFKK